MQIHLLYFVKPCQNRPESPADEWRALNINWVSRQSSGCTAPSDTTGRHCVPKKGRAQRCMQYITPLHFGTHWGLGAHEPLAWEVGASNRELHQPEQRKPNVGQIWVFSLHCLRFKGNNPPREAGLEAMGPHKPVGWEISQLQKLHPAEMGKPRK